MEWVLAFVSSPLRVRNSPSLSCSGTRKGTGATERTASASGKGREAEEPAGCWQEGAAGGEDADLANPSGFPELTQIKAIFLRGGW